MSAIAEGLVGRGTTPAEVKRSLGNWIGGAIPVNKRGIRAVYFERSVQRNGNCRHEITPSEWVFNLPSSGSSNTTMLGSLPNKEHLASAVHARIRGEHRPRQRNANPSRCDLLAPS
jgi:hypothetical protein